MPVRWRGVTPRPQPAPRTDARFTGEDVAVIFRNLAQLTNSQEALSLLEERGTSCIHSGNLLHDLMQKDSISYCNESACKIDALTKIEHDLRAGRLVIADTGLPTKLNPQHMFTIEPLGDLPTHARIIHSWQDIHSIRAESEMPIGEMLELLKKLTSLDWVNEKNVVQNVFCQLFGEDKRIASEISDNPGRPAAVFKALISGALKRPLDDIGRQQLDSIISDVLSSKGYAAAGPAVGFVFGLGGVLISGEDDPAEVASAIAKPTVAFGIEAATMKYITTNWERSLVRDNAVSGLAFFAVFAIWDVTEWKMHEITAVELRQRLAEGLGATAGGIAVGIGGGALAGAEIGAEVGAALGPVGVFAVGLIGSLVGGIAGALAGKALDGAIWDESEDSVVNSYEFFGWHDVERNTRPVKTADEMKKAYDEKLESKASSIKEGDWDKICKANVMVLLPGMHPASTKVMKMANDLHVNRSDGVSVIATMMYHSVSDACIDEEEEEERKKEDEIYLT